VPQGEGGMSTPVVVKPRALVVDKQTYNTIRSFVESSTKTIYSFNIGVCRNGVVVFRKKSKWRLTITPKRVVLRDHRVSIYITFNSCIEIDFGEQKICVHESELKEYDIVPSERTPYMKSISLYDFVNKILVYYEVAQDCW
jgi:hypothetical protein